MHRMTGLWTQHMALTYLLLFKKYVGPGLGNISAYMWMGGIMYLGYIVIIHGLF